MSVEANRPRPWTIVDFERIMLGSLAAGLLVTWFYWDAMIASQEAAGNAQSIGVALFSVLFGFGLNIGLTLLISRRRSTIAKWIAIGLFVLGLPFTFGILMSNMSPVPPAITLLQVFVHLVAYVLLFTPSARRWMKREPEISPEIFS